MKPDTDMMSYQNPPIVDEDETVDLVVVTTITPPTTTTSIHRSLKWMIVIVAGMMLVTGGAVLMQDGSSYYHSSGSLKTEDGSITTAAEDLVVGTQGKKTAMTTTTPTPTLQSVIAQYPELNDYSPEDQDLQYQAYLLYLNGMTVEELNAYYNINGSQQDGGGGGGETRTLDFCCKDNGHSAGCYVTGSSGPIDGGGSGPRRCNAHANNECRFVGARSRCCRSSPDSRLGTRTPWVIGPCR